MTVNDVLEGLTLLTPLFKGS